MPDRSLAQWLEHIQSVHFRSIDMELARVRTVSEALNIAQPPLLFSVAGTNGKGSCVAMLESVLTTAGLRTGAYTSPHLVRYNERVRIDGVPVTDDTLCKAFETIEAARSDTPLTYFEFSTLAAMRVFDQSGVEACVLEVGMGGRLDAVNIYDADVAIVTSIGLDHTQWLGDDRETIAKEKAGIFRSGRPGVCGDESPPASLLRAADGLGAKLFCQNKDFSFKPDGNDNKNWRWTSADKSLRFNQLDRLPLPNIPGSVQRLNTASVVTALAQPVVPDKVSETAVRSGLARARLAGRLHHVTSPYHIVFDVAHNAQAVEVLRDYLASLSSQENGAYKNIKVVYGMLADKPIETVVTMLADMPQPAVDAWYVAALNDERGLPAKELAVQVKAAAGGVEVNAFDSPVSAFDAASSDAKRHDLILVFGSFITVGDILAHLDISPFDQEFS